MTIVHDINGIGFDFGNEEKCLLLDREIMAKQIVGSVISSYYIMVSNDGIVFDVTNGSINKKDHQKGLYYYNLKKCNELCYNNFILYLKHRNKRYLAISQRSFSNG